MLLPCVPKRLMFCKAWLIDSTCVCRLAKFWLILLLNVVLDSESCKMMDAFAAKALPYVASVSLCELLLEVLTALAA